MNDRRHQPIGYWLKQVDTLLTESINKIQASNGVSRSEWQVLNTIAEQASAREDELRRGMRALIDVEAMTEILSRFVEREWIEQDQANDFGRIQLTEQGRQHHQKILLVQRQIRERTMDGISEQEYETVIRILQRMASNLEALSQ